MSKTRILMVCESYTGGVFSYVTQLCNDMCDEFEVSLAFSVNSPKKRRPQTPSNYRDLLDSRVKLYEIKDFGSAKNILKTIRRLKEIEAVSLLMVRSVQLFTPHMAIHSYLWGVGLRAR